MEKVKKPGSSVAIGSGLGRGRGTGSPASIQVNWTTAIKGLKKNIQGSLKDAVAQIALAQKHRSSTESGNEKASLKDGQKILQESIEATEDILDATPDTELGHERLKDCLQALLRTTMAFKDLLYHVAPKAKPIAKEDK